MKRGRRMEDGLRLISWITSMAVGRGRRGGRGSGEGRRERGVGVCVAERHPSKTMQGENGTGRLPSISRGPTFERDLNGVV